LGFFWVSSCSEKRLFLKDPFHTFVNGGGPTCSTLSLSSSVAGKTLENALLNLISRSKKVPNPPLYIYSICGVGGCIYFVALTDACIDCRVNLINGTGTTKRPDFWE
jgi:D-serine dehydratase